MTSSKKLCSRCRGPQSMDMSAILPPVLCSKILLMVPPRHVARSCALVSTAWAQLCQSQGLWKELCEPWSLTQDDASQVLGGWRGLYSLAFGTNLIHSPCFEGIPRSSSGTLWDDLSTPPLARPFESSADEFIDRLASADDIDPGYRTVTHWVDDKDGDAVQAAVTSTWERNTCYRTEVTEASDAVSRDSLNSAVSMSSDDLDYIDVQSYREGSSAEFSGSPSTRTSGRPLLECLASPRNRTVETDTVLPPEAGTPAIHLSTLSGGHLKQSICFKGFSRGFLDECPPLRLSAWFSGQPGKVSRCTEQCRLQVSAALVLEGGKETEWHWRSEDSQGPWDTWQHLEGTVSYGCKGLSDIHIRVRGQEVMLTKLALHFEDERNATC